MGKLVKGLCIAIFGQTLPEDALLSRIALMSILGFFFLPLFFFSFSLFSSKCSKVFCQVENPVLPYLETELRIIFTLDQNISY